MTTPPRSTRLRRIRLTVLAAAACLGLIAATGAGTAQAKPAFGFTENWDPTTVSMARGVGADSARLYVCWCVIEASPGRFSWIGADIAYNQMLAQGQRPLVVAVGTPNWARTPGSCPAGGSCQFAPDRRFDANWQNFVRAMAQRYPQAMGVEIWNEPNYGVFFAPRSDPTRFTELLKLGHTAVKSVNPGMPVVSGGLAGATVVDPGGMADDQFLQGMYNAGAKNYMDAIGDHFYPSARPLTFGMRTDLERIRGVRNRNGDGGKPIWVTEFGLSTANFPGHDLVSEPEQGAGLVSMYCVFARSADVPVALAFRLRDTGDGIGIFRSNNTPKPAADALRNVVVNQNCPPVPSISVSASATQVAVGQRVSYRANGYPGSGAHYHWDLDGSGSFETYTGSNPTASSAYRRVSTRNVRVQVTDNLERYFAGVTVLVGRKARPQPRLRMYPSNVVRRGTRVVFSGSGSLAPFGRIRHYAWDIVKSDRRSRHYTGRLTRHVFPRVGRYRVRLTVTDSFGKKASVTRMLTVDNKVDPGLSLVGLRREGDLGSFTVATNRRARGRVRLELQSAGQLIAVTRVGGGVGFSRYVAQLPPGAGGRLKVSFVGRGNWRSTVLTRSF